MLAINIQTPSSMIETIKDSFKQKRLSFNLTQEGLSNKSGVSLGSIKRFETTGQISLESLLKIAFIPDFRIKSTTHLCFMGFFEKNRHYNLGY